MTMKNMDDQDLVKAYLEGKEIAFEILIKRHQQRIFAFIMSKVGNSSLANDIFQDVFIKVINTLKLGKYNEEGKFLPWIYRITHNLIIDHFRKTSKVKFIYDGDGEDDFSIFNIVKGEDPSIENNIINKQVINEVKLLIEKLPEEQKNVLKMRFYQEMSFKEIAEETNVSINTSLGRMRYAILNLRKIIEENELNFQFI